MVREKFERNKPHVNVASINDAMDGNEVEDTNYDKYITGIGYNNHNPLNGKYAPYQYSNDEILLMIICILLVLYNPKENRLKFCENR